MNIIIGLGNPGDKFKNTRHNAGFMVLDKFAEQNSFPAFEFSKKENALLSEGDINGEKVILVEPQTFMNESGKTAKELISYHTQQIKNLIIIHDDMDLSLGKIKIIKERGSAGHNGVESIINNIGNDGLIRIRVGIQPEKGKPNNQISFVIKKFTKEEMELLLPAVDKASQAINYLLLNGLEKAMNEYNR